MENRRLFRDDRAVVALKAGRKLIRPVGKGMDVWLIRRLPRAGEKTPPGMKRVAFSEVFDD